MSVLLFGDHAPSVAESVAAFCLLEGEGCQGRLPGARSTYLRAFSHGAFARRDSPPPAPADSIRVKLAVYRPLITPAFYLFYVHFARSCLCCELFLFSVNSTEIALYAELSLIDGGNELFLMEFVFPVCF